ncbi:hypothetical protein KY285_028244 [Solanum tuberosum]|nr:hypothetical protein KY285_028244 [Solanum tuberosum]
MVVKFSIVIPDDIVRVVVPGSRDIVNYCGLIMRHTMLFRDDNWQAIITKTWRSDVVEGLFRSPAFKVMNEWNKLTGKNK